MTLILLKQFTFRGQILRVVFFVIGHVPFLRDHKSNKLPTSLKQKNFKLKTAKKAIHSNLKFNVQLMKNNLEACTYIKYMTK